MTTDSILMIGAILVVVVISVLGVVLRWRTPDAKSHADRPAMAAVFAAAAIDEPGFDRRIRRARLRYAMTAGAAIGGVLAYVGYLCRRPATLSDPLRAAGPVELEPPILVL